MFRLFLLAALFALPAAAEPLSAEDIRADFQQLYETLRQKDTDLYAHLGREEYDSLYQVTLNGFTEPAERPEVAKRFQRFVAAGGVSHARIDENYALWRDYLAKGGRAFPLKIKVVHGRYYVAENLSGVKGIRQGEEIYAINRESIRFVFARAERNLSSDTHFMALTKLESDFPMALWLELGAKADHVELTFARKRVMFHKVVPFLTEAEMAANAEKQPPVLRLDSRREAGTTGRVGYMRPGPFMDLGNQDGEFERYLDNAFLGLETHQAQALVIDLRDNFGGTDSCAAALLARFAAKPFRLHEGEAPIEPHPALRFSGPVYLLINRKTYSAAAVLAAAAQDQRLAVLIGEKTADLATNQIAMESFTLAKSGLQVGFPTRTVVRPAGESAPRSVFPDLLIETPVIEAPTDPVLQDAILLVTEKLG